MSSFWSGFESCACGGVRRGAAIVTPSFAPDRKSLSTGRFQFTDLAPDFDDSCGARFAQTVLAITNQGKLCSLQPESKTIHSESLQLEQQSQPATLTSFPATTSVATIGRFNVTEFSNVRNVTGSALFPAIIAKSFSGGWKREKRTIRNFRIVQRGGCYE